MADSVLNFREPYYKVAVKAPAHTRSGYGEYSRGFLSVLNEFPEFDVTLFSTMWGNTPFIHDKNHPYYDLLTKSVSRAGAEHQQGIKYDVSFQIVLPDEWDTNLAAYNVGITAATEVDRSCKEWQEACNKMDLVIAMSEHTKRTLLNGPIQVTTPIVVFGSPLKKEFVSDVIAPTDLELDPQVKDVFLHVGQLVGDVNRDRKNTFGMIKAFKDAFKNDPTKALVIKTNMGRNTALDRQQSLNVLKQFVHQNCPDSKARVYLLHGPMTDKQMAGLYAHPKVRAFVSFTRGEGFGLPFQEAAAAGLPIIATNWSSYLDFLGDRFIKVDYTLSEVGKQYIDGRIIPPQSRWAEVPMEAATDAFVKFVEKGYFKPNEIASKLKPVVQEMYSVPVMVNDLFNKLCAAKPELFSENA